jgi:hypothetical protein
MLAETKARLKALGMTQREFSVEAGVWYETISRWGTVASNGREYPEPGWVHGWLQGWEVAVALGLPTLRLPWFQRRLGRVAEREAAREAAIAADTGRGADGLVATGRDDDASGV